MSQIGLGSRGVHAESFIAPEAFYVEDDVASVRAAL